MKPGIRGGTLLGCFAALATGLRAQQPPAAELAMQAAYLSSDRSGDHQITTLTGGVLLLYGATELRADHAVVRKDLDEFHAHLRRGRDRGELPASRLPVPPSRRLTTPAELARRFESFAGAAGAGGRLDPASVQRVPIDVVRTIYLEGNVVVVHAGVEAVRCARLHLSLPDDRALFEAVTLRLRSTGAQREQMLTVRAPRLVRQGIRTTGRDVSVTTSRAGAPHFDVRASEVEIVERGDRFEVKSRGNALAIHGVELLPLPSYSMFTGEQSQLPIRGLSGGYSDREGLQARVEVGTTLNEPGGALHRLLTGRPADEFRGDWTLGLGWIEERGFPADLDVDYRAGDLYAGRTRAFGLDDDGENIRDIRNHLDGRPIDEQERSLVHSENRIRFSRRTHADLTLFAASDPAVWSEFFERDYREAELPESSALLIHAHDHALLTLGGRWNATGFAYGDDLRLTDSFVEETPLLTFDLFGLPLLELPGDSALLLTAATNAGELRREFDNRSPLGPSQESARADQLVELAAPFAAGPITVRPYFAGRITWYEEVAAPDGDDARTGLEAGIAASTRLTRTWPDAGGGGLRHVITPSVALLDRFHVTGEPADYLQFDRIDALDERTEIRLELLNRLQRLGDTATAPALWLDLAQIVTPISGQNDGHHLGLFEYELILRPALDAIPLPNFAFLLEGEHDWNADDERTLNVASRFDAGPFDLFTEWRTDRTSDGAVGLGASTALLHRWNLGAGGQYDLDSDELLALSATIQRQDLDWVLSFGVDYSVISDETRIYLQFEPTLGGIVRSRANRWSGASRFVGATDLVSY